MSHTLTAGGEARDDGPVVVMVARSQSIADMVDACARGELPFSGPDSLCAKVAAMGFTTTSLYPAVRAAKEALDAERDSTHTTKAVS